MAERKQIHTLVIDTGPMINNDPAVSTLLQKAGVLVTVPATIPEIRDKKTRARVETTLKPFLTIRQPNPKSVQVIRDFARRTGDLSVLSKADVEIIALTYELECELNGGDWRLKTVPGQKKINGVPPKKSEQADKQSELVAHDEQTALPLENIEQTQPQDSQIDDSQPQSQKDEAVSEQTVVVDEQDQALHEKSDESEVPAITMDQTTAVSTVPGDLDSAVQTLDISKSTEDPEIPAEKTNTETTNGTEKSEVHNDAGRSEEDNTTSESEKLDNDIVAPEEEEDDSDSDGWITPSNLKKQQAKDAAGPGVDKSEDKNMQAAVMTTDFAMQNVILQMGLNLLSSSMMRIKYLKTFVLRCHSCFQVVKDMNKQFCPRCGQPTLTKVSCSTSSNGEFKIHLKKNFQWNTRGNVYAVPKPVHGSSNGRVVGGGKGGWGNNLILAEDQKEYERAKTAERRRLHKEKNLMDEDYLPGILSGSRAQHGGKIRVGAGRNVNSKKR